MQLRVKLTGAARWVSVEDGAGFSGRLCRDTVLIGGQVGLLFQIVSDMFWHKHLPKPALPSPLHTIPSVLQLMKATALKDHVFLLLSSLFNALRQSSDLSKLSPATSSPIYPSTS